MEEKYKKVFEEVETHIFMLSKIPNGKVNDAQIARIGIIAELDAINLYEQLASVAKNKLLKKVLLDIAHEEKEHFGEFLEMLKKIDKQQVKDLKEGEGEVKNME